MILQREQLKSSHFCNTVLNLAQMKHIAAQSVQWVLEKWEQSGSCLLIQNAPIQGRPKSRIRWKLHLTQCASGYTHSFWVAISEAAATFSSYCFSWVGICVPFEHNTDSFCLVLFTSPLRSVKVNYVVTWQQRLPGCLISSLEW